MGNLLSEKAMLVRPSISMWTARKYDRTVSDEVADTHNSEKDMGRFNKVIISPEEIKKIQKIANEARIFHYYRTLPWSDEGSRILPCEAYMDYMAKMGEYKSKFEGGVQSFLDKYTTLVEEAKVKLNSMFNVKDYPPVERVADKFNFSMDVYPIPEAGDLRLQMQEEEVESIKKDIEKRLEDARNVAMSDLWARLYDVVSHMAEKLHSPDAIFRDSLISNISKLCSILPSLNIESSPELEAMRKEVEHKLCSIPVEDLRKDTETRQAAAMTATELLKKMSGYIGQNS